MKRWVHIPVVATLLGGALAVSAGAAELLDVKPVGAGGASAIEVSADIPMTYTYYKVPGQARAVVDIADADPEKVEPLIVVNKGAVASISVDKAMLGDMTVSRLVFNLVSEADISVKQSPDKKVLLVSFGDDKQSAAVPAPATAPIAVPAPVAKPAVAEPVPVAPAPVVEPKAPVAEAPKQVVKEEDDPLGLDEQPQTTAAPAAKPAAKAAEPVVKAAPASAKVSKIEPVVPATAATPVVVKGIVVGASYIDIQTNAPVEKFKQLKLSKPERLAIEIAGTSKVKVQTIQVKRFGISKVRVGATPGMVRLVLDTPDKVFPAYEATTTDSGVRITFK